MCYTFDRIRDTIRSADAATAAGDDSGGNCPAAGGLMAISSKLLSEGEHVVISTRTHWKALVFPVVVLIVTCGLAGFLLAVLPSGSTHDALMWVVIAVAAIVIVWWTLRPFIVWLTTEYTVTNRRIIHRSGIITRRGRDIPLYRINDVSYERDLLDRMLGCGTLVIAVANEEGSTILYDVPRVEQIQLKIADLMFRKTDTTDEDTPLQGPEPDRR
jgi:uncharacterized membrane protein YdbT with pleckstrin-like domain